MTNSTNTTSTSSTDDREILALAFERMAEQRIDQEKELLARIEQQWQKFSEIRDKDIFVHVGYSSDKFFTLLLNSHPAKRLSDAVDSVRRAFDILTSSKTALIDISGRFHYELVHGSPHQVDLNALLREATKEVYTYGNATESLVQAYRHMVSAAGDIVAIKFESLKNEIIGKTRTVRFFKDLRNSNNHVEIFEAAPHYNIRNDFKHGKTEVTSGLAFRADAILHSDRWSSASKEMAKSGDLQVVELVSEHYKLASDFFDKVLFRVGIHDNLLFRDIAKLKVARKSMSYRHTLGIVLQFAVPKKLNPYEYLSNWFTKEELERAYSLPDHSKEQIEYLISLKDPLGLCDSHTRQQLYRLFGIAV